jgi:urease accessory protein
MDIVGTVEAIDLERTLGAWERTHVAAELRLAFVANASTCQTMLESCYQQPPLKVVRAFALEDGAALVHLHNVSGGLLGGDRMALTVRVGAGALAQLTTTGATRIYRPRAASPATEQSNTIEVGEDGLLEYLPDAVIPFAGARYSQRTSIRLARGAGLFWWEILSPGREAHGELFEYKSVELRTDLTAEDRLIAVERVRLEPRSRSLTSLARLGAYRSWATFYICRVGLGTAQWMEAERELREALAQLRGQGALWGISTLTAHGLVVRCVAKRGRDILPGLHALWNVAKWRLYGRAAVMPRKVN